jgi:hypothetical protein
MPPGLIKEMEAYHEINMEAYEKLNNEKPFFQLTAEGAKSLNAYLKKRRVTGRNEIDPALIQGFLRKHLGFDIVPEEEKSIPAALSKLFGSSLPATQDKEGSLSIDPHLIDYIEDPVKNARIWLDRDNNRIR